MVGMVLRWINRLIVSSWCCSPWVFVWLVVHNFLSSCTCHCVCTNLPRKPDQLMPLLGKWRLTLSNSVSNFMTRDHKMASSSREGVEHLVAAAEKLSKEEPFLPVLPRQADSNNGSDSLKCGHVTARESSSKNCLDSKANVSFMDLQEAMKANEEETIIMKALIAEKKSDSGENQKPAPLHPRKSSFTPIAPKPFMRIPDTPPRKRNRGSYVCAHCGLAKKGHICPSQCVDACVQTVPVGTVIIQKGDIFRAVSVSSERTP